MGKNQYSTYESASNMLSELGWRSLEDRRIDTRMIMITELPTYFERPLRYTRHMDPLAFRQIHTGVSYYQHSFYSASIVLWNKLPSEVDLTPSGKESVR